MIEALPHVTREPIKRAPCVQRRATGSLTPLSWSSLIQDSGVEHHRWFWQGAEWRATAGP